MVVEGETLLAVEVTVSPTFTPLSTKVLFPDPRLRQRARNRVEYDVSSDGQRFVTIAPVEGDAMEPLKIRIVQNRRKEFRDREPG